MCQREVKRRGAVTTTGRNTVLIVVIVLVVAIRVLCVRVIFLVVVLERLCVRWLDEGDAPSSLARRDRSVPPLLYFSWRATLVCLAFARPRPMARPPR
ncbi:hypothetical protein SCALM49S_00333 [Streptomyces californicus]